MFGDDTLCGIGEAHGKTAGQVALRWLLQKGVAPVTMSTKPANQAANFDIMNFSLSNVEMAMIDSLAIRRNYRIVDADRIAWAPKWD